MRRALIIPDICRNCQPCEVEVGCEMMAIIREEAHSKPWIDFFRCRGCMKCMALCNFGAIQEISRPCDGKPRPSW